MKKSQNKKSYFCILYDEKGEFKGKLEELEVKEVREVKAYSYKNRKEAAAPN